MHVRCVHDHYHRLMLFRKPHGKYNRNQKERTEGEIESERKNSEVKHTRKKTLRSN